MEKEHPAFKEGMLANLEIIIKEKKDVLSIPQEALHYDPEGEPFVYVLRKEGKKKRKIKIGLEGENLIEVLEGLKEGEAVVLVK